MSDRREFLIQGGKFLLLTGAASAALEHVLAGEPTAAPNYTATDHWWGMIIDVEACIGCGNCVRACKEENGVPKEPFYFRTWVERYHVPDADIEHPEVDSPNGGYDGFREKYRAGDGSKNFFVPKLCNHCAHSPCVQVCPVGATFESPDGVVLVDKKYCLGCRYCVHACPYGCRFIDPEHPDGGQVLTVLPPHHEGAHHGLLRDLPHGCAHPGRPEGPERSGPRVPAHPQDSGPEAADGHGRQGLLQRPRRLRAVR